MVKFAVLFPGQGSQTVGMGAELFGECPDLLVEAADRILGWSLRDMCLNGPEEALTRTEHAQPALFAIAYALWTFVESKLPVRPSGAAGHSLGEYTALAAADAISFEDGLYAVHRRGQAMARAADLQPGGMAALIGVDPHQAESVASTRRAMGGRLQVANINAPGQIVVAGGADDIEWLSENGGELGVRRVIPVNVAGAFHSTFMAPASAELAQVLDDITFTEPTFPVWSNTTATPHDSDVAATLVRQVVSPVRFAESLTSMAASGIDTFIHIGPGDVTAGMARRTVPDATVLVISDLEDIDAAMDVLGTM